MDNQSGKRLKHFLQSEKIEQKKLAEELGTTAQYINAICQGRKGLGKAQAMRIQELYGVSAGWLLTGQGTMSIAETIEQPSTPPQDESPMQVIAQLTDLLRQSTEENARLRARVIELQNLVSTLSRSSVNYLDIAAEPTSNDNNQA